MPQLDHNLLNAATRRVGAKVAVTNILGNVTTRMFWYITRHCTTQHPKSMRSFRETEMNYVIASNAVT